MKLFALRLDADTFSGGFGAISRKSRILDVIYNATNNEQVRTKTIVKNCVVSINANSFRK
jgi:small subunit ribosomal protein S8e